MKGKRLIGQIRKGFKILDMFVDGKTTKVVLKCMKCGNELVHGANCLYTQSTIKCKCNTAYKNVPKRQYKYLTYKGRTLTQAQWSRELNIPIGTIRSRLNKGWDVNKAFETPIGYNKIKNKICPICNKEFKPKEKEQKYCSQQCQWIGIRKPKEICVCLQCGKEFIPPRGNSGMYCSRQCQWNSMKLSEDVIEERQRQKEYNKVIKDLIHTMDNIVNIIDNDISRISECKYCGNYYIKYNGRGYCSNMCRKKDKHRRYGNKEKRLKKNGKPDYSITLDKLYKRDKGICKLCGNKTNYNDYIIDSKGNFIVGYSYPSIDHIIPIAKGGVHQWYNVQLACFRCNALKRDKIV